MADLWAAQRQSRLQAAEPLASRMRPRTLEEFIGQTHILGPGKLLRRMVQADTLTSLIFHGPPGTGKTTLARALAAATARHFEHENAAGVGVQRIREILDAAHKRLAEHSRRTILFLDEIHRFSRAQQDVLLGDVERGTITLIGATTENPLFAINPALVSRSTLFRFEPLSRDDIKSLLRTAIADPLRGLGRMNLRVDEDALDLWATLCDGDARRALTALEVAARSSQQPPQPDPPDARDTRLPAGVRGPAGAPGGDHPPADGPAGQILITRAHAEESIQQKAAAYDHTGDEHYDAASALIKSVRGSDPDAALYWLARMLDAGEDPRFIARRLAILASEDIGNADPRAIMVAEAAWSLVERIGLPECRITLAQCITYLALAPKSNASYAAIEQALADVRAGRTLAVPAHIKDSRVRASGQRTPGSQPTQPYQYAHDITTQGPAGDVGGISHQDLLGSAARYYHPTDRGHEAQLAQRLEAIIAERARLRSPS